MRTLQIGDRPTKPAQAVAELGRIDKTIHALTYIDDVAKLSSLQLEICLGRSKRVL
jgi:TnpA family transposase